MGERPGRILLMPTGSAGDVYPLIAIGTELQNRGYEVWVHMSRHFLGSVEDAGLRAAPFEREEDWSAFVESARRWSHRSGLGMLKRIRSTWGPRVAVRAAEAIPLARRLEPDIVLGGGITFHGSMAAEACGAAWMSCLLSPVNLLTADQSPFVHGGLDVRHAPGIVRRVHHRTLRTFVGATLDASVNRERRRHGLGPVRDHLFGDPFRADLALLLFASALRPPARDDPDGMVRCGFVWRDRSGEYGEQGQRMSPELHEFLRAGEPPVIVSPGTIRAHGTGEIFEHALSACAAIGKRAVLVTGDAHGGRFDGRPDTIRVDYAPYSELLHRGCLTIHHGGTGTLAWSLRARRPMIVTPLAFDQFDHGLRVRDAGLGDTMPVKRLSAGWLADRIEALTSDPEVASRCESIGCAVEAEDGAGAACDAIGRFLAARGAGA